MSSIFRVCVDVRFFHFFRDFCTSLVCNFNDNGKLFENSIGMNKFQKKFAFRRVNSFLKNFKLDSTIFRHLEKNKLISDH